MNQKKWLLTLGAAAVLLLGGVMLSRTLNAEAEAPQAAAGEPPSQQEQASAPAPVPAPAPAPATPPEQTPVPEPQPAPVEQTQPARQEPAAQTPPQPAPEETSPAAQPTQKPASPPAEAPQPEEEAPAEEPAEDPLEPDPAYAVPDFTMSDANGESMQLSSLRGKPVLLNFWATWCYYCDIEMPDFQDAYETYGDDISFVLLNSTDETETREVARRYMQEKGYTMPLYFDDVSAEGRFSFNITGFPSTAFITSRGELFAFHEGYLDKESLDSYLTQLITFEETGSVT